MGQNVVTLLYFFNVLVYGSESHTYKEKNVYQIYIVTEQFMSAGIDFSPPNFLLSPPTLKRFDSK